MYFFVVMHDEDKGIYDVNGFVYFVFLCLVTLVFLLLKKSFVENATMAFEILEERGEMWVFHALSALQYLTIPLVYLWKFLIITFILWVGAFMFGYKITYSQMWKVVLISEAVFLVPEFLKMLWFLFIDTDANIFEIRSFYPLALINLVDTSAMSDKFFYPLKSLNVFEVIYWWVLAQGVHIMANKKKSTAYAIVLSSYVLFYLLWLGFFIMVYE